MQNNQNPVINAAEETRKLSEQIKQYAIDHPNDTHVVSLNLFAHDNVLEFYTLGNHQTIMGTFARGAINYINRNAQDAESELYLLSILCNDIMRRMQDVATKNGIQFNLNDIGKNLNEHPHTFLY